MNGFECLLIPARAGIQLEARVAKQPCPHARRHTREIEPIILPPTLAEPARSLVQFTGTILSPS